MSIAPKPGIPQADWEELKPMSKEWIWFLVLGLAMVVAGVFAVGAGITAWVITTIVFVKIFGLVVLAVGIVQTISSFWAPKWSGTLLHLLIGILYIVVGVMVLDSPLEAAAAFALLMSAFFIVSGVFRIVASLYMRFHNWGWSVLSGVVSLLLGLIIWSNWPLSTPVIGIFVGLEVLFNGVAWLMLALSLKQIKKLEEEATAAAE